MTSIVEKKEGEIEAAKRETFFNKKNLISFGLGGLAVLAAQQAGPIVTIMGVSLGMLAYSFTKLLQSNQTRAMFGYAALGLAGALVFATGVNLSSNHYSMLRCQASIAESLETEVLMKIAKQEITTEGKDLKVELTRSYEAKDFTSWARKPEEREMHISARVTGRRGDEREIDIAGKNTRSVKSGQRSFALVDDGKRKKLVETTGQNFYAPL